MSTSGNLIDIQDVDSFDKTSTMCLQTGRPSIIGIEADLGASDFSTTPTQEDGTGSFSAITSQQHIIRSTKKGGGGQDKAFEKEIGIFGELASKRADASELFEQLLQVAARYVDE
ncbi:hypothetical protein V5799_025963 [Amblyomma americanum]|uniref:Uncharacterized protein n=1 Tax=Amblyomma americanum TaxID=6943 RepID=A0AAQ4DJX7_AMBAM